jgi:hypothetical protein
MQVQKLVVKAGEGRSVWLGGMGVVFKVSGAETRGAFSPRPERPQPKAGAGSEARGDILR